MKELTVALLGRPALQAAERSIHVRSSKALAILSVLALDGRTPRSTLAALLWQREHEHAMHSLRNALLTLRQDLGVDAAILHADRRAVWLEAGRFTLDVQLIPTAEVEELLALWRGPFLDGLHVRDSEPWEEWRHHWQEEFSVRYTGRAEQLVQQALQNQRFEDAHRLALQLLHLTPLSEHAATLLIRTLSARGRLGEAARVAGDFRARFTAELGVEPDLPALPELHQPARPVTLAAATHAPTRIIGREREISRALDLLQRQGVRLLTLRGPGGIGKSRLARELAAQLAPHYELGSVFVELAALRDASHVLPAIATSLNLPLHPQSPLEAITAHLGRRRLLLVLDNVEHLLDAAPDLVRLLRCLPGLQLIVTSRRALNVTGEHELPLHPLSLVGEDGESDAVRLFVERARACNPELQLDQRNRQAVTQICELLEGVPLSLELAAARLRAFTPLELLTWLDRPLEVLTGGARDLPQRLQSLRSTLEWSYELLNEADRELFLTCGVFVGGFTLDALQEVSQAVNVREGVHSLVEQSFVKQSGTHSTRYLLLESLRELALEKLVGTPQREELLERHARYYVQLAERIDQEHQHIGWFLTAGAYHRTVSEHANLISALSWCVSRCETELALRLAHSLFRYWHGFGSTTEGRVWLQRVMDLPDVQRFPGLLVRVYHAASMLAHQQDDPSVGLELFPKAIALQAPLEDQSFTPALHNGLAFCLLALGRFAEAETIFDSLARQHHATGNALYAGLAYQALTQIQHRTGRHREAIATAQLGLELNEGRGNWRSMVITSGWKALAHRALREHEQAWQVMLGSIELCVRHQFDGLLANTLLDACQWLAQEGHQDLMVQLAAASATLQRQHQETLPDNLGAAHQRALHDARLKLGADQFEQAWAQGSSFTPAQVLSAVRERLPRAAIRG